VPIQTITVNNCKELAIKFTTLASKLKESAVNFAAKSHGRSLNGFTAALDGWLCRIQVPPAASKAFYGTRLATFSAEISTGYYVVADNAYTLSVTLLIPYSDKRYPAKDVFNFYLSQLRIKIEQVSGEFKKPSKLKLSFIPMLLSVP
jgi:hypothetical protein